MGDIMKTLTDVKPGETVTLVRYHESGDIGLRRHLLGMGFVKGAKITIKKVATLGDPIEMRCLTGASAQLSPSLRT